jgi:parallel beta-helix repeat protein
MTAVFLILAFLLLVSSFTVASRIAAITPLSARKPDAVATSVSMLDFKASSAPFPVLGVWVNIYPGSDAVRYVNFSDFFYVNHGFSVANWSRLTADVQSAFLDPQQTYFTLQTSAPNFQNPPLIHFTDYESAADVMNTLFFFQFHPGDLAPGTYTFTGIWSSAAAANPPNYTAIHFQNTITLVVNLSKSPTLISCSPNLVSIGWPVTCTATVSGSNPTGTVTWSTSSIGGSFSQSVCTLSSGTCSTTYFDNFTGSVTIAAYYSGDPNNPPSSGSTTLTVTSGGSVYYSANYISVQASIDAAPPGATVIIAPGFYSESLTINKPLTIIGEKDPPVFGGGASGIYLTLLSGASGSIITGLEITNFNEGILVSNASNCRIYSNIMASMGSSGIVIEGSDATNNVIFDNIFQDTPTPINITASAANNTIHDNIISSQSIVTLNIGADGNSVYGNSISASQILVNLTNSQDNLFYHNDFLSAVRIEAPATGNTVWDNGYPSGGNYWNDYKGVDQKKGQNQDQPGSDNIGDTPYIIYSNNMDRYPLVKPWPQAAGHCVAVTSVVAAKTVIGQGFNCSLTVNVADKGEYNESFNVTVFANATAIGTEKVSALNATCTMTLLCAWNTAGLAYGSYTISAYAQPVTGQTDTSGNTFNLGTVKVTIPGDINGDFKVGLPDLVLLAQAYGSKPDRTNWNSNADLDGNSIAGLSDLVILAQHYGQHYP